MKSNFAEMLAVGGKTNSLGRAGEVLEMVLSDQSRLVELYECLFDEDAWVRMRAVDTLEKVCRQHPEWLAAYIDKLIAHFSPSTQPSIQWHLAQIYGQVKLSDAQKQQAIDWLEELLGKKEVDWIVAANAMDTLVQFTNEGDFPVSRMLSLLTVQQQHKSKAVVKRASKLRRTLS